MNELSTIEGGVGVVELEATPLAPPASLFRTDDPTQVIQRATEVANALKPVLTERGMLSNISGKEHVRIEGWQTLGAMLGVTPVVEWTRPLDDGWEARAAAQTLDGRIIGAGEGECRRSESRWAKADDYAVRSMAQTRAQSKALASVLRFVVTLAGYSGTPAEEMTDEMRSGGGSDNADPATPKQRSAVTKIFRKAQATDEVAKAVVHALAGNPPTKAGMSQMLDVLMNKDDQRSLEEQVEFLVNQADAIPPSDVPADAEGLPEPVSAEDATGIIGGDE